MRAILGGVLMSGAAVWATAADLDVSVTVDFGRDLGQNLGTLFEMKTPQGRLACGAGFASVYNTYFRGERMMVQFFMRPPQGTGVHTIEPIPRAGSGARAYLRGLGDDVLVSVRVRDNSYLRWQETNGQWQSLPRESWPGNSAATVRGRRLEGKGNHVVYGGKPILDLATSGGCRYHYYGQGHLFFYRKQKGDADNEIKEVVAIPWSPYDADLTVDLGRSVSVELTFMKEGPYAWGQFGNEVLNCSNWGGLYAFDGTRWKVLVEAEEETSYQIYSMVNYGDRLLMAQYPSGVLFSYDGREVKTLTSWPPVPQGASPSAREAQTTAIYRGELLVGVWPWAELWRRDPDKRAWVFMRKMFTHPEFHANPVHPYEPQAKAAGLVLNELGQRLTAMVPVGDSLLLGTSYKGGSLTIESKALDFLTPAQRQEYGAMYRLKMPGNVAAAVAWRDGPTKLRFRMLNGRMSIHQDGRELACSDMDPTLLPDLSATDIQWGNGVFGPCLGALSEETRRWRP